MSNEERVENLAKRIKHGLVYSNTVPNKNVAKPNVEKLKKLAKDIRKNLEDYTGEATTYPHTHSRS
jgi:hypothetical protein